jgi:hypothetical protein
MCPKKNGFKIVSKELNKAKSSFFENNFMKLYRPYIEIVAKIKLIKCLILKKKFPLKFG